MRPGAFMEVAGSPKLANFAGFQFFHSFLTLGPSQTPWVPVSKSGMQSLLVIDDLQKLTNAGQRVIEVAIFVSVNLVLFERFHERLTGGIVVGIALSTHANSHCVIFQQRRVFVTSVLYAAIGMMH
jgi:hypothetical protein